MCCRHCTGKSNAQTNLLCLYIVSWSARCQPAVNFGAGKTILVQRTVFDFPENGKKLKKNCYGVFCSNSLLCLHLATAPLLYKFAQHSHKLAWANFASRAHCPVLSVRRNLRLFSGMPAPFAQTEIQQCWPPEYVTCGWRKANVARLWFTRASWRERSWSTLAPYALDVDANLTSW